MFGSKKKSASIDTLVGKNSRQCCTVATSEGYASKDAFSKSSRAMIEIHTAAGRGQRPGPREFWNFSSAMAYKSSQNVLVATSDYDEYWWLSITRPDGLCIAFIQSIVT